MSVESSRSFQPSEITRKFVDVIDIVTILQIAMASPIGTVDTNIVIEHSMPPRNTAVDGTKTIVDVGHHRV